MNPWDWTQWVREIRKVWQGQGIVIERREDLALRNQRSFSLEFKRQVVEVLLSGKSCLAQLCRRHNITSSLLYHWRKQYSRGKFNNEPTEDGTLQNRIEKLERLVGRLTLENEFLKKGLQHSSRSSWIMGLYFAKVPLPGCVSILSNLSTAFSQILCD